MNIAKLCRHEVVAVDAGASLREAATLMAQEHVGALVVTTFEQPTRLVGVVTDRDLALEVLGSDSGASGRRIGELAKSPAVTIPAEASLDDAVRVMEQAGVRRLLVVDPDGGVAGIVSFDDLLGAIADQLGTLVRGLRRGMEHERGDRRVSGREVRPHYAGSVATE